ncbi:MAG: sigma-54-dependent Fis family transcriptional regulator [Myxococcales bacterium]|nr:sigma-54-dependent Fis family transcriptional regulator [Myxococcales bacterium]
MAEVPERTDRSRVSVAPRALLESVPPNARTERGPILGGHPTMHALLTTIRRVAPSSCTVLVTGESGTGKELVVAALHEASPRRDKPMVTVNCGAIPENLLESELFGHAKGAFTGAHAARQGRVAAAEGGALFLDEIGEMPLVLQVKLLRLLQQREYSPVGEDRARKRDIRVVAATHRDLEAEVAAGRFREDLYYRLEVVHVALPPLRERGTDVELLARHFFRAAVARSGRSDLVGISPEALAALQAHDWPGNIRALENVIERAVLLSIGPFVELHDLPPKVRGRVPSPTPTVVLPEDGFDLRAHLEAYESSLICKALDRTGWNKARAAELLGINRTTLVEMVKRKRLAG